MYIQTIQVVKKLIFLWYFMGLPVNGRAIKSTNPVAVCTRPCALGADGAPNKSTITVGVVTITLPVISYNKIYIVVRSLPPPPILTVADWYVTRHSVERTPALSGSAAHT